MYTPALSATSIGGLVAAGNEQFRVSIMRVCDYAGMEAALAAHRGFVAKSGCLRCRWVL